MGTPGFVPKLSKSHRPLVQLAGLRYDPRSNSWVCDRSKSHDNGVKIAATEDDFLRLVKNVYRVLLTRGMKGCYVYFLDEDTRSFFESRIQHK